ncbi:FAD-binding protein [Persicimonas caeni]|uniref:FAD-binding protein n=1 Tax=Persicimonas caeni TaxID=2292766 RepID=A0A4Y6PVG6_PERCE|nr:FAD-dependent oxidoreductase [Persicimonas caeni]QDG52322.1 FAD-binding protein [Persicimonas caeni]QED33544.1 FAD-binding protein [Persicimonas caeni]
MSQTFRTADVAIIGAGTTGAAAAMLCARRGLETVCVERRDLTEAGARWVNGVPASFFDRAGIARPEAPERMAMGVDFHLVAGWGPERVVVRDHELMEVDMRLLVERLQRGARDAGAELVGSTRVEGMADGHLQTSRGPIEARWYIDASGMTGARLLGHPAPAPRDICAAAQAVHTVTDTAAARRFCEEHDVSPGHTLCFTGIEGGYSILNVRVDDDHVSLLTGSIPAEGHRSGHAILQEFAAAQPWIGERQFGGSRAIPIRRPYARFHEGNRAVIGDAACQVFSAHGSGIGPGLVAARFLADALAEGRGLAGYTRDWQRHFGGLFAGYTVFRRFSQTLSPEVLETLMRTGLMDAEMAAQGLLQQMPSPDLDLIASKLKAAARAPRLALQLTPVLAKMGAAQLLYAGYPASETRRTQWRRLVDVVLGI